MSIPVHYCLRVLISAGVIALLPDSLSAAQPAPVPAAANPSPYRTLGAPADPKVSVRWNMYHDHAAATKMLRDLAQEFPRLAKLSTLGKSYGEREMWLLTISNFERGKETEKPAFWIDGGIHANEIQSSEVPLYTAWYLLEMYGRSETVTRLVDERVFYIMPIMSPDARDAHMYQPNTTHSPRSGLRPVDDDRDGLIDEDRPDDLDGDGSITQMRMRDPNGKMKPHADYPNLLVRVKPGEKGEFTLLGQEGFDNDGDGAVNEDGDGSYDPNRGWAWNWEPDYVQRGAHYYPLSVLETRMVADFIAARPNIAGAQSYHNAGGMILRGPGAKSDAFDGADVAVYTEIAAKGERMLPGYKSMNIAHELYEVFGGEVDHFHMMHGAFAFTNELFTGFNYFREKSEQGGYFGTATDQLEFNKLLLLGDGFAKWREVNHPQYGKIEVGGLRKEWVRQPPSFLLEEECHRNMAFTLYHADQLPLVRVRSIDVQPLAGKLVQVTATIANERLTPTHNAADVKNKITPPDLVRIEAENLRVVTALTAEEPLFRNPVEQRRQPQTVRLRTIPGHSVVYVRWLIEGAGPFTVSVQSVKGGSDRVEKS